MCVFQAHRSLSCQFAVVVIIAARGVAAGGTTAAAVVGVSRFIVGVLHVSVVIAGHLLDDVSVAVIAGDGDGGASQFVLDVRWE